MVRVAVWSLALLLGLGICGLIAALWLVASPFPPAPPERDVFGFEATRQAPSQPLPPVQRYRARDGEALAYRFYDAPAERILIFVHGSSYHGGGYHDLAAHVSASGAAKVVLPNLRGHYLSGRVRGDIDHIGQYEEDLVDLIRALRADGHRGPIVLGGHSSGGGFVLRFAGGQGPVQEPIAAYLALAPIIPRTAAVRNGDAGGWNVIHLRRIIGLVGLNLLGLHGFDGLPVIAFNKPVAAWDGSETLAYSWRLNVSYHPRNAYAGDVAAMPPGSLVLVGARDEAVDAQGLGTVLREAGYRGGSEVLPDINHFGIFRDPAALKRVTEFVASVPSQ
jgi:acetyl esterase/lipase